jgi:hypothetical protein
VELREPAVGIEKLRVAVLVGWSVDMTSSEVVQ